MNCHPWCTCSTAGKASAHSRGRPSAPSLRVGKSLGAGSVDSAPLGFQGKEAKVWRSINCGFSSRFIWDSWLCSSTRMLKLTYSRRKVTFKWKETLPVVFGHPWVSGERRGHSEQPHGGFHRYQQIQNIQRPPCLSTAPTFRRTRGFILHHHSHSQISAVIFLV